MCHMKRTTVRELHLQTSAILHAVSNGESHIVEQSGVPVAELRPLNPATVRRLPNREAIISRMAAWETVGESSKKIGLEEYFDTYVAKCYLNEVGSQAVRELAYASSGLYSSSWCVPEMACVFQRQIREFKLPGTQAIKARDFFLQDVQSGVWQLIPVSEQLLFRAAAFVAALPRSLHVRAGDAVHLAAAQEAGFSEIWSNDKHILQAAAAFGLSGRSI